MTFVLMEYPKVKITIIGRLKCGRFNSELARIQRLDFMYDSVRGKRAIIVYLVFRFYRLPVLISIMYFLCLSITSLLDFDSAQIVLLL